MKKIFSAVSAIILLTSSTKADSYAELPVDKILLHEDHSIDITSTSQLNCKNTIIAPGQISQEDVDKREFRISLLGTECSKQSFKKEQKFHFKDLKEPFYNFLKEKIRIFVFKMKPCSNIKTTRPSSRKRFRQTKENNLESFMRKTLNIDLFYNMN